VFDYVTYENRQGKDEIAEFIKQLGQKAQTSKYERVRLKKIMQYLDLLVTFGTRIGEPFTKHIEDDIWELRPLSDRIFYAYWKDNKFVLLHQFEKKTQKTPKREIEQAKRNLQDWLERNDLKDG